MIKQVQKIPFYQVDAFALKSFTGNPAAVFLCENELEDNLYLDLAREMYLPETTFLRPLENQSWKNATTFEVRWFMADRETSLCGHATLAAAHVIFNELQSTHRTVIFKTNTVDLEMQKNEDGSITMKFPVATDFVYEYPPLELVQKLGIQNHKRIQRSAYIPSKKTWILELEDLTQLQTLAPDFLALKNTHYSKPIQKVGVTVLANQEHGEYDFISRFFCPWIGIDEDALSAVSHGLFAKFWQTHFQKNTYFAFQDSKRTGEIKLELLENDEVLLIGKGITTLEGIARV